MVVNTRKRAELKSYFVKNSIPTEGNFADLIDAMLNQKDDGVVKLPGNPLTIEAAGDAAGTQNVLNFYRSLGDSGAEWTLSLNPRAAANDARTARRGFGITDGDGKLRLFIDRGNGNVGFGVVAPPSPLSVAGGAVFGSTYAQSNPAPANGLIVEGLVGVNTPTPGRSGFEGLNGYATVPAMNIDYRAGFTVEAWVLFHSFRLWSRIIDFGNGPGKDNILFANEVESNNLVFQVQGGGRVTASNVLELNVWMHLAVTVNTGNTAVLYKNGSAIAIAEGGVRPPPSVNRTINYIGRSNWMNDADFDGRIRDLRIWNTPRNQQQIFDNRNVRLQGNEANLVAYWPFEKNDPQDKGPNKLHAVIPPSSGWFNETLTVQGGVVVNDELYVRRKIHSPQWKVTNVLYSAGGLPLNANLLTDGGTLLLFVSGSGWGPGETQIGMQVLLNGEVAGTIRSYSNERGSHKAFVSNILVSSLGKGQHKVTLSPLPGTASDGNDFFGVTAVEMPI